MFRVKRKPDETVDRFKARLAAMGYDQRPRLDCKETFSPVVKPATIRTVLTAYVGLVLESTRCQQCILTWQAN